MEVLTRAKRMIPSLRFVDLIQNWQDFNKSLALEVVKQKSIENALKQRKAKALKTHTIWRAVEISGFFLFLAMLVTAVGT